jgi:hypothetical protein
MWVELTLHQIYGMVVVSGINPFLEFAREIGLWGAVRAADP